MRTNLSTSESREIEFIKKAYFKKTGQEIKTEQIPSALEWLRKHNIVDIERIEKLNEEVKDINMNSGAKKKSFLEQMDDFFESLFTSRTQQMLSNLSINVNAIMQEGYREELRLICQSPVLREPPPSYNQATNPPSFGSLQEGNQGQNGNSVSGDITTGSTVCSIS